MPTYDLVCVGTGFATAFFLHRFLERRPKARVLVLEAGERVSHAQRLRGVPIRDEGSYVNRTPDKPWIFSRAVGGGSHCWWACTPRMLPADFELRSRYGVGRDWPLGYAELEPYYGQAEALLAVAGDSAHTPFERSSPYPQPPHRLSSVDKLFKASHPEAFFALPTARPSRAVGGRPACCNNSVCSLCPIDSKFTLLNGLPGLFERPGVTLVTGAAAQALTLEAGVAKAVRYLKGGEEHTARAELFQLGANALFNAHILLRSGVEHPLLGRGLCEQSAVELDVDLDGVDNFDGGTSVTGHGYMLYDGPHRAARAAALMETWNAPQLRPLRGKWRQRVHLKFIFEELPQPDSRILFDPQTPTKPVTQFAGYSAYNARGRAALEAQMPFVLRGLPVEGITLRKAPATESHILGGTVMGRAPEDSVVDSAFVHHRVRNLLAISCGAFPTAAPANPTLTLCALALRAADRVS